MKDVAKQTVLWNLNLFKVSIGSLVDGILSLGNVVIGILAAGILVTGIFSGYVFS